MRRAITVLAIGVVLLLLCVGGCVVLLGPPLGTPARWTYGVGRFCLFKSIVEPSDCRELVDLLRQENVAEFNRLRNQPPFAGKYLDLSGLRLVGKDLPGVDLSRCILQRCNFSGSDLTGSSFRRSYVAETQFYWPFRCEDFPTPKMARRTNLEGAHFESATLESTTYGTVDFGYASRKTCPQIVAYCKHENATGLPDYPFPYDFPSPTRPVELSPDGVKAVMPTEGDRVLNAKTASVPCQNPFAEVQHSDFEAWRDLGCDVEKLSGVRAVRIEPQSIPLHTDCIFNPDPNVVMILSSNVSATGVISMGPVVIEDRVHPPWFIVTDNVLWFRHRAMAPVIYAGHPVVAGPYVRSGLDKALISPVFREPGDGISAAWLKDLLAKERIIEVFYTLKRGGGTRIGHDSTGQSLLQLLGAERANRLLRQHPELAKMPIRMVDPRQRSSRSGDLLQLEPKWVLVLSQDFALDGNILSAGPVILVGSAKAKLLATQAWVDGELDEKCRPAIALK